MYESVYESIVSFFSTRLPIAVFIFLKLFGKNEFAVTPLFQDSIQNPTGCNSFTYQAPYTIPDSMLTKLDWNRSDSIMLVVFDDKIKEERHIKFGQIQRIREEFDSEKFSIWCIVEKGEAKWLSTFSYPIKIYELSHDAFTTTRNCIFLLPESDDAVIIDSKKRIRGQYDLDSMEDGDRLVVHEMNILFRRY